jgi:hypothetical protein
MKYLVNRKTKEHVVCRDEFCIRSGRWTLVEADSEGWIPHAGNECPLPGDCMTYIREDKHQWVSESAQKAGFWNWRYVTHYRPILEQAEKAQEQTKTTLKVPPELQFDPKCLRCGAGGIAPHGPHCPNRNGNLPQEPDYDPRSVSFNLLDRLDAAHEAAAQIPDILAEIRERVGKHGYDLVARSPCVDDSAHPPSQPQVPEPLPMEPFTTIDKDSKNYRAGWNACRLAMLSAQEQEYTQ